MANPISSDFDSMQNLKPIKLLVTNITSISCSYYLSCVAGFNQSADGISQCFGFAGYLKTVAQSQRQLSSFLLFAGTKLWGMIRVIIHPSRLGEPNRGKWKPPVLQSSSMALSPLPSRVVKPLRAGHWKMATPDAADSILMGRLVLTMTPRNSSVRCPTSYLLPRNK